MLTIYFYEFLFLSFFFLFYDQRKSGPNPSMFSTDLLKFCFFSTCATTFFNYFNWLSRPMVSQLAPPKIPEGERVDFDVSYQTAPH